MIRGFILGPTYRAHIRHVRVSSFDIFRYYHDYYDLVTLHQQIKMANASLYTSVECILYIESQESYRIPAHINNDMILCQETSVGFYIMSSTNEKRRQLMLNEFCKVCEFTCKKELISFQMQQTPFNSVIMRRKM